MFDLTVPEHAYIFGFLQCDGHMSKTTRNRGRISLELSFKDYDFLKTLQSFMPVNTTIKERTRNTNFKKNYKTASLNIFDLNFRTELNSFGLPYGAKSDTVTIPAVKFSEPDYYRGLIDADGSVGITAQNLPFISFATKSDNLAKNYTELIKKLIDQDKKTNKNKRDNIYNIMVMRSNALEIIKYLYYDDCLALPRKEIKARTILETF